MGKMWCILVVFWALSLGAEETAKQSKEAEEVMGVHYYSRMFGHVHTSPLKSSSSLTTVGCGHPIKVMKPAKHINEDWKYVKVGTHKGYVEAKNLSANQTSCFQSTYPKFFNSLNLDLSELYYWGRLYDQYIEGKSSVSKMSP